MSPTLVLTQALLERPSLTPDDAGCQNLLAERLAKSGFQSEHMRFGKVDNLWARFGTTEPLCVFAGHTDVVPTGPLEAWQSDPFQPVVRDGYLYGRGAADMKSGLAAMVVAAENFLANNAGFKGSIAFLITSDEEGPSIDGTQKVIAKLVERQENIAYCIIGEASSHKTLGDQIRVGRRGSLHGNLTIHGKQGHVAYPELGNNPIHSSTPALDALAREQWDNGNDYFPPTTFQITNVHSGTGAANVIPGTLQALFNFRFCTALTQTQIENRVRTILDDHQLHYDLEWHLSGNPFLTQQGKLVAAAQAAIQELAGIQPVLSTGGGTSDGRFIAPTGAEVIEMGPINETIHQIDECVLVSDLDKLTAMYEKVLEKLFF